MYLDGIKHNARKRAQARGRMRARIGCVFFHHCSPCQKVKPNAAIDPAKGTLRDDGASIQDRPWYGTSQSQRDDLNSKKVDDGRNRPYLCEVNMKIEGVNHIALRVRGAERSAEFYKYYCGMEIVQKRT
jgi:hypothetical protein